MDILFAEKKLTITHMERLTLGNEIKMVIKDFSCVVESKFHTVISVQVTRYSDYTSL